jgi:hypothetical protein
MGLVALLKKPPLGPPHVNSFSAAVSPKSSFFDFPIPSRLIHGDNRTEFVPTLPATRIPANLSAQKRLPSMPCEKSGLASKK